MTPDPLPLWLLAALVLTGGASLAWEVFKTRHDEDSQTDSRS